MKYKQKKKKYQSSQAFGQGLGGRYSAVIPVTQEAESSESFKFKASQSSLVRPTTEKWSIELGEGCTGSRATFMLAAGSPCLPRLASLKQLR